MKKRNLKMFQRYLGIVCIVFALFSSVTGTYFYTTSEVPNTAGEIAEAYKVNESYEDTNQVEVTILHGNTISHVNMLVSLQKTGLILYLFLNLVIFLLGIQFIFQSNYQP
jgi:hypothetical protein